MAGRSYRTIVTCLVLLGIVCTAAWWAADRLTDRSVSDNRRLEPETVSDDSDRDASESEAPIPPYLRVPLDLEKGSMLDRGANRIPVPGTPRYRMHERVPGQFEDPVQLVPPKIQSLLVPESLEKGSQLDAVPRELEHPRRYPEFLHGVPLLRRSNGTRR